MPDLLRTLQGHDLGFLKIVAEHWGLELEAPDAVSALPRLSTQVLNRQNVAEIVETLPADAYRALTNLLENEGMLSWAQFSRRFGDVRVMGAGRRDRERPDLKPESIAEVLWYRALIGKAFFNRPPEPQEYAYVPDDLLELLPSFEPEGAPPLGRPASPAECAVTLPASDRILDHACTLLAALRMGIELAEGGWETPVSNLTSLLGAAALLDSHKMPLPESTRAFLEASRADALVQLVRVWQQSTTFNELRLLPGLAFEGEWQNNPLHARQTILNLLSHLPQEGWWSLPAFVAGLREEHPDFQRPAGDYDSWFIRKADSTSYLRGFSAWDEIDGALVRFMISGPLHWLGIYDLASPAAGEPPAAFRPSRWAVALWHGSPPDELPAENVPVKVSSDAHLTLAALSPRSVRYKIARFCEWIGEKDGEYLYRMTPASLEKAGAQGLRPSHLLNLLRRNTAGRLPPEFIQALERWEKFGVQAHLEKVILLRVAAPEVLAALRKTRASRFLGEAITPTVIVIRPGGEQAVRAALAETGYLADARFEV